MYQFGITGMGRNGFMNQIMTSQAEADKLIMELKADIECRRDPNDRLAAADLSMIMEEDLQRVKYEVERYAKYGY